VICSPRPRTRTSLRSSSRPKQIGRPFRLGRIGASLPQPEGEVPFSGEKIHPQKCQQALALHNRKTKKCRRYWTRTSPLQTCKTCTVQRQSKKKKEVTPYDCMPPDSKGTLWMQWDVFICQIGPKRLIRPPNLFPNFHTNERSTVLTHGT
jgi:hypothetical protein